MGMEIETEKAEKYVMSIGTVLFDSQDEKIDDCQKEPSLLTKRYIKKKKSKI